MKNTRKVLKIPVIGLALIVAITIGIVLAGCASMTVVGVDNDSVTGPRQVRQYGTIDPNDITVYAFYKDDSRKRYSVGRNDITFDNSRAGRQTVNVRVSGGFTASFETEVMALTGITVVSPPETVRIGSGSALTGLDIQGTWDQMGSSKITNSECQITGYDPNRAGNQTITVAWNGQQTSFNVNVVEMQSIRITSNPTKTTYYQGESIDLTGLKVVAVYPGLPDTDVTSIRDNNISGFNTQTTGRQTLTLTYNGKTATFDVTVQPIIGILNGTWKGTEGMERNQTWTFNNGTFVLVHVSDSGVTTTIRGTYTITGGFTPDKDLNISSSYTGVIHNYGMVDFKTENPDDLYSLYRWNAFSIDANPRYPTGTVVQGDAVLTTIAQRYERTGYFSSSYRLSYIKQ